MMATRITYYRNVAITQSIGLLPALGHGNIYYANFAKRKRVAYCTISPRIRTITFEQERQRAG